MVRRGAIPFAQTLTMFDLFNWVANTPTGVLVARSAIVVLGLSAWVVLICVAGYSRPKTLKAGVGLLLIGGGMAGVGAVHCALVGNVALGFVWVAIASMILSVLALIIIGNPAVAAERLLVSGTDSAWSKPWKRGLCRTSDFCELLSVDGQR